MRAPDINNNVWHFVRRITFIAISITIPPILFACQFDQSRFNEAPDTGHYIERYYPSRVFAGPKQYPPRDFKAYGIVAFPSLATKADESRYQMICDAYVATLLYFGELPVLPKEQMVTVWPIKSEEQAKHINDMRRNEVCKSAVPAYGLLVAIDAIADAKTAGQQLNGIGPFLLAWAPSTSKGQSNVPVLVSDLSDVTTLDQAKLFFLNWANDIQQNSDLWKNGWNLEQLAVIIRLWADKYGPKLLRL